MSKLLLNQISQGFNVSLLEFSNKGWVFIVTELNTGEEVKRVKIVI